MTDPKMSKKQVLEIIEASLEKAIDKVAYARINTYDAGRGTGQQEAYEAAIRLIRENL